MMYDTLPTAILAQFQQFQAGLKGVLLGSMLGHNMRESNLPRFKGQMAAAVTLFMDGVEATLSQFESSLVDDPELLGDTAWFARDRIHAAARQAANETLRQLRKATLEASIGGSSLTGPFSELKSRDLYNTELKIADARGRLWVASEYVRTAAREYAVKLINRARVEALLDAGVDVIEIAYPDENHRYHGLKLSISGKTAGLKTLDEMGGKIFHPNTQARIK